jgi:hypothetical protein
LQCCVAMTRKHNDKQSRIDGELDTTAAPSAAPVAGGATTPGSRFGGQNLKARLLRAVARVGRHMTGFAYRELRKLDDSVGHDEVDNVGSSPAGRPMRAAGGPSPHERSPDRE